MSVNHHPGPKLVFIGSGFHPQELVVCMVEGFILDNDDDEQLTDF